MYATLDGVEAEFAKKNDNTGKHIGWLGFNAVDENERTRTEWQQGRYAKQTHKLPWPVVWAVDHSGLQVFSITPPFLVHGYCFTILGLSVHGWMLFCVSVSEGNYVCVYWEQSPALWSKWSINPESMGQSVSTGWPPSNLADPHDPPLSVHTQVHF